MTQLLVPGVTSYFMSDGFGIEPKVYKGAGSNKVYSGVAVFRSGTFRDSNGMQNTWEDLHISQMMDNFDHLVKNKKIIQVPARDGHKSFLNKNTPGNGAVVGWHQNVQSKKIKSPVDGLEYNYILADYEITEPYANEKIVNGTFRNRSAEIGTYTTNNEAEFWPVYLGFAFVDFSAVEGLNFSSSSQGNGNVRLYTWTGWSNEEKTVDPNQQGTGTALPFPPSMLPGGQANASAFTLNGQQVTDPAAVQAHINRLEQFVQEARGAARANFVSGLVRTSRVPVTQQDAMVAFANSLNDEQYGQWIATWGSVEQLPLLANHGGGVTNPQGNTTLTASDQAIADAEAVVKMHELTGMPKEQLAKTASYAKLVAAGKRTA